jgi:acetylornithine deacetylase/succinyl-diaminopimelate desuccinylase-like protein
VSDLRRATALALLALAVGSLHCRRAGGEERDPVEREAEANFISYLRIDTSNPPGNETAGAQFLQQLLIKEGLEARLVGDDPKRQSVYARLKSGSNEKALLLLHHIDVVPADAARWTKPPFGGVVANGYIWGRGALDIKSLGIAELMAVIDLQRRRVPLRRDVVFLAAADEEAGGLHGCGELLEKHPELFTNVGYVLNEGGTNETIVDKVPFWGIEVQEKVPLWLRLTFKGPAGHSAAPPDGGGSVGSMIRALDAIQKIETPYRLTPSVQRGFRALGATRPDERGELLRGIREPLDVPRIERVLPAGYRSLLHDTIAVTRIDTGTCTNCIPAAASAYLDVRLLDDEKPDAILAKIKSLLPEKNATADVLLTAQPVAESPSDSDLFATLAAALKRAEPESVVAPFVSAGTSDSRWFRARGIAAYGIAPFKVNYYDADTVHANDERIRQRFFWEGVRLMRDIVERFCAKR